MEAATSVAVATRGISMAIPSSRKEWRVVSDHPLQNPVNEDLDRSKLGQADERLIYEVQQGRESGDLDFHSVTVAGGSDHDLRFDDVVKQREQLQHLEVNLKARLIARSEVMQMQERFDTQIKEQITANFTLEEQVHEREKTIHELQRALEDKDKELHSIKLDHEAAWAKEDLLREQNKELATFRRERDNLEAERAQHLKKLHDLQEHIQEKDQQLLEMQEQHRVAQETIIYKDEQIREAQSWITRAQEMDVLQSTTNHSLQAELRDRMEQYNQLWLGCQRQFAEMERVHLNAVQQLQLELSEAREKNGTQKDTCHFGHIKESEQEEGSKGLQNGNAEIVSSGNASTQTNQITAAQMAQSLHGMPTYLPLHPFIMHQPQNLNAHLGQFHSMPISHWQNQQALLDGSQLPNHENHPFQNDQRSLRSEASYDVAGQGKESHSVVSSPNVGGQVKESGDGISQQISSKFQGSLNLNHSEHHEKKSNTGEKGGGVVGIGQRTALIDEESLLACVVRTIPGGRIRVSETLLNRLNKMLAPLNWGDYRRKYGELDDFLGIHPELFFIEGEYIQVREGAQEIIAAMAAHAKVRAAAVSNSSSVMSSVAVTPMRGKKMNSSLESSSRFLRSENQTSNVRILSKHNDLNLTNGNGRRINHQQQGGRSGGGLATSSRRCK